MEINDFETGLLASSRQVAHWFSGLEVNYKCTQMFKWQNGFLMLRPFETI